MDRFVVVAKPEGESEDDALKGGSGGANGGGAGVGGDSGGGGGGGALACCCCMSGCGCAFDAAAPRELRRCACWRRATCRWRCAYCCCAGVGVIGFAMIALCIAVTASKAVDCAQTPGYAPGSAAANVPVIYVQSWAGGLLTKAGKPVYIDALGAIGIGAAGNTDLSLPGSWQGAVADAADPSLFFQTRDDVASVGGAEGLVQEICLGCLFCFNVLQTYVAWNAKCLNRPQYYFTYDWRRDNYETASQLRTFARGVSLAHNKSKVQLLGYSNGAGLSLALLNAEPGLVHSAVFVSGAYSPGLYQASRMGVGESFGLTNTRWFPKETYWTSSLPYSFLSLAPGDRSWPGLPRAFRDSVTGADVALDLSAAQTWLDYGLLPSWAAGDARLPALQNILLRARMYRQLLQPNASIAYPPTAVVTSVKGEMTGGSGNYTVDVVRRSIDWTPTGASPTGDGSVCTQCAMPPYPVPPSRVFFASTGTSHRLMMQDMVAIKAAMDSVGPYPSAPIPATFAA